MVAAIAAMPTPLRAGFGGPCDATLALLDVGAKGPARDSLQMAALPQAGVCLAFTATSRLHELLSTAEVAMPQRLCDSTKQFQLWQPQQRQ